MKFITKYRLNRALREHKPEHKESKLGVFKRLLVTLKSLFFRFTLLGIFSRWLNKQAFGTIVAVFTLVCFIAIIIANQLRYYYWQNIMRANYPNEVLGVVDKVLVVFNARQMNLNYWIFTVILVMMLVSFNRKYCSAKPQSIPRAKFR